MSDSGKQLGDCQHARTPAFCVECLREENARQAARLDRWRAEINQAIAVLQYGNVVGAQRRLEMLLGGIVNDSLDDLELIELYKKLMVEHRNNAIASRKRAEAAEAEVARLKAGLAMIEQVLSGGARIQSKIARAVLNGADMRNLEEVEAIQ